MTTTQPPAKPSYAQLETKVSLLTSALAKANATIATLKSGLQTQDSLTLNPFNLPERSTPDLPQKTPRFVPELEVLVQGPSLNNSTAFDLPSPFTAGNISPSKSPMPSGYRSSDPEKLKEDNEKLKTKIHQHIQKYQNLSKKYEQLEATNTSLTASLSKGGKTVNVKRNVIKNPNAKKNVTVRKLVDS
jgi:hypothetical protein